MDWGMQRERDEGRGLRKVSDQEETPFSCFVFFFYFVLFI